VQEDTEIALREEMDVDELRHEDRSEEKRECYFYD